MRDFAWAAEAIWPVQGLFDQGEADPVGDAQEIRGSFKRFAARSLRELHLPCGPTTRARRSRRGMSLLLGVQ